MSSTAWCGRWRAQRMTSLATSAGLAAGTATILGATRVHATTIEVARGALVLTTLPDGTHLAVLTIRE